MRWSITRRHLVLIVLMALLAAGAAAGIRYVVLKHQWAQAQLDQLGGRYARLLGIQSQSANLASDDARARALLARYAYPPAQDANQAGNDAQQRVRDIFSAAGLDVISLQVLAAKQVKAFDRIPLSIRAEGTQVSINSAFVALGTAKPVIRVDSMSLQVTGAVRPDQPQRLQVQLELSVLKERP